MTVTQQNDYQLASMWAHELLNNSSFCILDTETTGLGNTAEIVQIAILDPSGNTLLDSLVKPTCPIESGAIAIHGINDATVKDAPNFSELLVPILQAIGNRDLIIYNCEYDLRLIRQSLRPYGIQLAFPTSDRRQCRVFLNGGSIHCAMLQYSAWCGEWNDYHGNYRWQRLPGGDHSALGDCKATLSVMRRMAASHQEGA
jgi:DNA polymerase-3 subunit epsilon